MKKKIIRIGTKRKPKPTKKERFLTGDIQTKVELILYGSSPSGIVFEFHGINLRLTHV
jgi:hypothetical protein